MSASNLNSNADTRIESTKQTQIQIQIQIQKSYCVTLQMHMTNRHGCHTVLPGSFIKTHVSAAHSIILSDPDVGSRYGVLGCATICVRM